MSSVATITPKTWADGDLLRASVLNAEVRDALRFLSSGSFTIARMTSDASIPSGVRTNIIWSDIRADTDGIINEPDDTFTFTRDGVINVRFTGQYSQRLTGVTRNFIMYYNGSDFECASDQELMLQGNSSLQMAVTLPVRAGNTIAFACYQDSGVALTLHAARTGVTISWAGAIDGTTTDSEEPPPSGDPPVPAPSPPPTDPTPTKHVKTYYATWSQSYCPTGITWGNPSKYCYQGYYSSASGNLRSLIGFNSAQIVSDLAGAQNVTMELTYYVDHSYYNSGMTVVIGGHKYTTKPSSWSDSNVDQNLTRVASAKDKYHTITFGWKLRDRMKSGLYKGIAIGPGVTTSRTYYGYLAGAGLASRPKLKVTYYK